MKKLSALVPIISVTLSGCAMQQGDFPSLLKRPYEDDSPIRESSAPAVAISSLSAEQQNRLNAAAANSGAADDQFQTRLPLVKKRVAAARGGAVSSESWIVAQMELAALEIVRSPSVEALADIDALYRDQLVRQEAENMSGGTAVIAKQRDAVRRQVESQQAEIDAMKSQLR